VTDVGLWWLALGLGLVVLIIAVALLHLFLREVHKIERHAQEIWQAGKEVAANTATTWQLQQTATHADALVQEAQRHATLLGGDRASQGGGDPRRGGS
jgi:hypothetical protein